MSHQKGVDAVTAAGEHLIKLIHDHMYVKPLVDELNQLWKCANQLAVEKERRLRKALEVRLIFGIIDMRIYRSTEQATNVIVLYSKST